MTKPISVKMNDREYSRMESIRDRRRFPTQSDFILEAIRRMVREERRQQIRKEMQALAMDDEERQQAHEMAEAGLEEWADRNWPEGR